MKVKKQTMIFVGVILALIIIYDVYALAFGGTEASISHLIITWSYKHPILPFSMGIVMGHLFWRMRQTKELDDLKAVNNDLLDELRELRKDAKEDR